MTQQVITSSMQAHAEQLVSESYRWSRGRSKVSGAEFYVIPASTTNAAHYTSEDGCTCKSFTYRGQCSHRLAVQIHEADADIDAHMAESAGQFARDETRREQMVASSRFFDGTGRDGGLKLNPLMEF